MTKPLCRQCRRKPVNRRRGLCWECYYTPGLRAHYPSLSKHCPQHLDFDAPSRPSAEPTPYPLGSRRREEDLAGRVSRGEALHHPDDCRRIEAGYPCAQRKGGME